jgi:hypothetical protein
MNAPIAAASAKSGGLLATHFWHGIEAFAFLAVTLGGIAVVEWWQRRDRRRPQSDDADPERTTPIVTNPAATSCPEAGNEFLRYSASHRPPS